MARPREFDTTVALDDLRQAFWSGGYEATGLTDLEEATGLARARLYAAFGSKQDMFHRAIDHYLEGSIEPIVARVEATGIDGIAGWFEAIRAVRTERPAFAAQGCLMVNSMVELGETDAGVVQRGARYRRRVHAAFRNALQLSSEQGEFDGDVDERADLAFMLLMGLFVTIRSGADVPEVERRAAVAIDVVEGWKK